MAFQNIKEMDELGLKIVLGKFDPPTRRPTPIYRNPNVAIGAAAAAILVAAGAFLYYKYKNKKK